jgi:4-amino-4-deoxy-L-arabinose transferase-like glycosyltransferase
MKKHIPVFKRSAFLILLLIIAYYIRRDLPAVIAHPELARGLAIFFLVALSGLLFTLSLQVHKEKEQIKKKLGEKTYNWLVSAESGTKPDRGQ